jgi:hypothetical protein
MTELAEPSWWECVADHNFQSTPLPLNLDLVFFVVLFIADGHLLTRWGRYYRGTAFLGGH